MGKLYLCVLCWNLQCQRQLIHVEAVIEGNDGAVYTRFDQVISKVLKRKRVKINILMY